MLLYEFKAQIADYLEALGHTSMRTLADLIAFNLRHCPTEMKYFGQELFEFSESTSGDLTDPVYLAARAFSLASAGANGIDAAMSRDNLDAIIAPSYSFASTPGCGRGVSEHLRAGRTDTRREAGGHLDVQRGSCTSRSCWRWPTTSSRHLMPDASRRCSANYRQSPQTRASARGCRGQ